MNSSLSSSGPSGLSIGAKIGIIVGSIIGFLILVGIAFVWWKKRKSKSTLTSHYDPRFGALDISSPNQGGYINPAYQTSPTTQAFIKYNPRDYHGSEKSPGQESKLSTPSTTETSPIISGGQPSSPPYGRTSIPVHQAYLSNPQQSIQSTLYGPPASDRSHPSPTGSGSSPQHSPNLTNRGQGLPPSPRSGADRSTFISATTFSTPSTSATVVPSRKLSRSSVRDRDEGLALRYQNHHHQLHQQQPTQLPPPPPPPQVYMPLLRTAPARTCTSESSANGDIEQWPGSM